VATHLDSRNALALAIGGALTASALDLAFCETPPEVSAHEDNAQAIVTHTPGDAWPPIAGDLDVELAASAIQRIAESASYDAGVDAGAPDGGPPIPVPDGELEGVRVRRGFHDGYHYIEVVLGPATFDDALPVVFLFHGRGGNAQLPGGPFLGLSHPVRVIVPQAADRLGTGWEWLPVSVGSGLVDRLSASLFQVSSRIARLIRTIARERATIGRPIVAGFSQGGLLAYSLALHHDDVVGHAFPLSTWLPPPLEPLYKREDLRYPSIRSMHGALDPIIPVEPTRALVGRLRERGFDVELHEFDDVGHEMSAEMNALFHQWLDRAVCDAVGDPACAPEQVIDPDADGGGPPDAGPDGADES
jgi:phospholipase/carboxylesterase